MKTSHFSLLVLLFVVINGCYPVQYIQDSNELANRHKTIAILPTAYHFTSNKDLSNAESSKIIWKNKTYIQERIEEKLSGKYKLNRHPVSVIPIESSNASLYNTNMLEQDSIPYSEICDILRVDGLVISEFSHHDQSINFLLNCLIHLIGGSYFRHEITALIQLYDRKENKIIYQYKNEYYVESNSGSVRSGFKVLIRQFIWNLPYFKQSKERNTVDSISSIPSLQVDEN